MSQFAAKRLVYCGALFMGGLSLAQAAIFSVNNTTDAVDVTPGNGVCATANGVCSLRAAIQEANALAGDDVILVPAGVFNLTLSGVDEDAAAKGDLDITSNLTLQGQGANKTFIDGMSSDRVFHVHLGAQASLRAITIRNGSANTPGLSGTGGGVANHGNLLLADCNIDRNTAAVQGGGIFNGLGLSSSIDFISPTLVVERCTISNNLTQVGGGIANTEGVVTVRDSAISGNLNAVFPGVVMGGGIYNYGFNSALTVERSTISGHAAIDGAGIYHGLGAMVLNNVTLSGNTARRNGGGLFNGNTVAAQLSKLINVTLSANQAQANDNANVPSTGRGGGGIFNRAGAKLSLLNTLIAGNTVGKACYNDTGGVIESLGHNLDDDNSCGLSAGSDIAAGSANLASLANNGGATQTHALLAGSGAIDAGVASECPATDQRGYGRTGACDIGAFEFNGISGVDVVVAPPPNTTVTPTSNRAPQAFSLPVVAVAGTPTAGVLSAADADGDALTYEVAQQPVKGSVGLQANGIPGSFIYTVAANESGVDSFLFRACDSRGLCSSESKVNIVINSGTAEQSVLLKLVSGGASSGPIQVVQPNTLSVIAPDIDFNYPLGAYFFSIKNVPTDPNTPTVVTLTLPANANIPANAVVRKLDKTGVWRTLESGPSATVSTATLDLVNRTITLTLRDNDIFDLDPTIGAITDPVAVGVDSASSSNGSSTSSSSESGGGGGLVDLMSALMLLVFGLRRRLNY